MSDLYSNIHALCEKEGIKDGTFVPTSGFAVVFFPS